MIGRRIKKVVGKMPDVTLVSSSSFCLCHTIPSQWWEQGQHTKAAESCVPTRTPHILPPRLPAESVFRWGGEIPGQLTVGSP